MRNHIYVYIYIYMNDFFLFFCMNECARIRAHGIYIHTNIYMNVNVSVIFE